nr:E-beta-farnesene synthase [Tanacetum cinerariifolium]
MALTAYADADHAGCQDTRRSTSGSAQFIGDKLTMALTSTRFPCTVTIVVPLLSVAITSSTPDTMADVNVNALAGQAPAMAPPWFELTKDTLRDALQITPVNNNQAFTSPPSTNALINLFNELGYLKLVRNVSNVITSDMFQPWRALTMIINLCLMEKHLDLNGHGLPCYRFFGASSLHTSGKKKATLIVIPSIWFTKLIIHHLQRKHKFHSRPDSPLYLPNKEPVLGYLKFSAKGTKREVFGMPIPGSIITADIQEASYYQEYLENVAKHRRYLAGETGSDPDSLAPKPTKPAKKPKSTAPKAPPRPPVSTPVTSVQPIPASTPAKPQGKKQPQVDAEDADLQRALEESLKSMHDVPRGPLPPVVIREPDEEESKKVMSGADEGGQGKGQAGPDPSAQAEGHAGTNPVAQDEGQPGSNPNEQSEGQAGPDPGNAEANEQHMPSFVVRAISDREHMDLDVADVSPQPLNEQMEEPASSSGTLSSLQHLSKDISFGKLFFSDKPSEADNDKATAENEVESMVSILIQQDMSSIPSMTSLIIDLTSRPESPKVHQQFKATATETTTTTTTTLSLPPYQQQSTTKAMMIKRINELKHITANLIQENKGLEQRLDSQWARLYVLEKLDIPHQVSKAVNEMVTDAVDCAMQAPLRNRFKELPEAYMKEILHQRMWETESYKSHEDHMQLYKALEKSMNRDLFEELAKDLAEARKKKKKTRESPKTPHGSPPNQPPPLYPPAGTSGASGAPGAYGSFQVPPPPSPPSSTNQEDEDMALDEQAQLSDDEDIRSAHILKTDDITTFMDWFCKRRGNTELKPQDLKGLAFEIVKVFHPGVIHLQYQMEECHKLLTNSVDDFILRHNVSKPLPLGGSPGQVTIQADFFFNKDLEYLRYGSKVSRPALSISKMKAVYYPDVGLKKMVPDQFWIEEECKYDIAAITVRTHMRILSVVRIEVFSMYGYDYMKKIVLRRADLNEHVIAERDFKHLVIQQRVEYFQLGIESYQTQLNLTKPRWDATGFKYKHDYTVIDSPRAVMFQDRYRVQMMMRFNEIHKFSDGTLQQINEALDYRIKDFKINRINPGLNMRFWTRKDVDRSKAFMFTIQKRLKTRRIFRNLESFVGGRVREGDYRLLKRTE